jgi:hypothetical protein
MIRAKIGDSLIDLTTLNRQKDLVEKSFDVEPGQLQRAIETGSFDHRNARSIGDQEASTCRKVLDFGIVG